MAVKVDFGDMALYNKIAGIPHITKNATNAGGKPVMSNDFSDEDFEPIKPPIKVCGKVEEVQR